MTGASEIATRDLLNLNLKLKIEIFGLLPSILCERILVI
jgi:hypothetical protein